MGRERVCTGHPVVPCELETGGDHLDLLVLQDLQRLFRYLIYPFREQAESRIAISSEYLLFFFEGSEENADLLATC